MHIGVLFPRSNTYPLIGADFAEGIKTYLNKEAAEEPFSFTMETIGFGGTEKEVYAKTEKLLMMDGVDVLVGFIDEKILELIKPLALASGKLMIVVNAGANHPINWVPQSNIVHLGLQHSFLCAVNGSDAAQGEKNKPAAVCSTFYDCGYLHLAAMVKEFQASGGAIKYNYINNQLYDSNFNITQLTDYLLAEKETRSLLCVFDITPASLFYKLLNEFSAADGLKLYVSPMMLDKKALEPLSNGVVFSVRGYLPWHTANPVEENQQFISHYNGTLKKEPTIFSLLGWETGIVLKEIAKSCNNNFSDGDSIAEKLKSLSINGPRGSMKLDDSSQYFLFPVIRCHMEKGATELAMEFGVNLEGEWEEFSEKNTEGPVSGWTNTYLCY